MRTSSKYVAWLMVLGCAVVPDVASYLGDGALAPFEQRFGQGASLPALAGLLLLGALGLAVPVERLAGLRPAVAITGFAICGLVLGALAGNTAFGAVLVLAVLLTRNEGWQAAACSGVLTRAGAQEQGLIECSLDGLLLIDKGGRITAANDSARKMLKTDPCGRMLSRFLPVLNDPAFGGLDGHRGRVLEARVLDEAGNPLETEIAIGQGTAAEESGTLVRLSDISVRSERLAELERLALHDALTGLPNRVLFHDRVSQAIAATERSGESLVVMMLDLNGFKQVNDTLGHHVGDCLLQAVGPRLGEPLRKADSLARLGGDEFAILLPAPTDLETGMSVGVRLVEGMDRPFSIDGMSLDLGVSVGLACYPAHGNDVVTLLQNADAAMYKAKRGKLGCCAFDTGVDGGSARRLQLQRDLRGAIDAGEIMVLFQPKVFAGSWQPSALEALVRWKHPTFGMLAPSDFLAIAEQTGLVMPLTLAVLNQVLHAQRIWSEARIDLPVAINISAKWLRDPEFPRIVGLLLENWQGKAENLILEIPESGVMVDPERTLQVLDAMVSQGIRISLDDFGTGYSSLPLLQKLPVHELKIDRSFVGEMGADQNAAIVVRSVVKLAHGLGVRVAAEGVEDAETAEWLAALGCDELQGYLFGQPMEQDDVPGWLKQHELQTDKRQPA